MVLSYRSTTTSKPDSWQRKLRDDEGGRRAHPASSRGPLAEWLGSGLQSRAPRFSGRTRAAAADQSEVTNESRRWHQKSRLSERSRRWHQKSRPAPRARTLCRVPARRRRGGRGALALLSMSSVRVGRAPKLGLGEAVEVSVLVAIPG